MDPPPFCWCGKIIIKKSHENGRRRKLFGGKRLLGQLRINQRANPKKKWSRMGPCTNPSTAWFSQQQPKNRRKKSPSSNVSGGKKTFPPITQLAPFRMFGPKNIGEKERSEPTTLVV